MSILEESGMVLREERSKVINKENLEYSKE